MSMEKIRILIADDEPRYVRAIEINLKAEGYEVLKAGNGAEAVEITADEQPDLVVLDIMMPVMGGIEACRQIREFSRVPIIMVTARTEDTDKVKGLDSGADDYVTKPYSAEELLARIRAILRRMGDLPDSLSAPPVFKAGDLVIDFDQKNVSRAGTDIHLPPTEYKILVELVKQAGRVLVPEFLLEQVWGAGYEGDTHLVRKAVHRLRQKVEVDPKNPCCILTRPGVGYIFQAPD